MGLFQQLLHRIEAGHIETNPINLYGFCIHILVVSQAIKLRRRPTLDDKQSTFLQAIGDIHKAAHLFLLSQQIEQGIEDHVDQTVRPRQGDIREIARDHRDTFAARFAAELRDHRRRDINAVYRHATRRQRQCNPTRANGEFQRPPPLRQLLQKRDGEFLIATLCQGIIGSSGRCIKTQRGLIILHSSLLMKSKVDFQAVDMPDANRLTIHVLTAVAEHEREMISQRMKAALVQAKARGTRLGNPCAVEFATAARATRTFPKPPAKVLKLIADHRAAGASLREIARELNQLGIKTPRGKQWYACTVNAMLKVAA
jgi:hypothetical protein